MFKPLLGIKIAIAGWKLVKDPNRLDEVIQIADDLGHTPAFDEILEHVRRQPGGDQVLRDRARTRVNLAALRRLPPGTFGRDAADFLDARKLDPESLPNRPATNDSLWLRAHLFETHDLWHVATGFDTDVPGEAGLQAFYMAQFPARLAPILLAIVFVNTVVYRFDEKDARMDAIARGWRLGKQAAPLLGVRWDQMWERPTAEVRARLGLPSDPMRAAA
jgi:ubiquinone biosynthesis protein COQ4